MAPEGNLDQQFQQTAAQLTVLALSQPRSAKLRVQAWLTKLREPTSNVVWKRNRNMYCTLLLAQLQQGVLEPPFTAMPPDGSLPNLPNHLLYRGLSPSRGVTHLRSNSTSPLDMRGRSKSPPCLGLHDHAGGLHPHLGAEQLEGLVHTFHSNMQARGFDISRAPAWNPGRRPETVPRGNTDGAGQERARGAPSGGPGDAAAARAFSDLHPSRNHGGPDGLLDALRPDGAGGGGDGGGGRGTWGLHGQKERSAAEDWEGFGIPASGGLQQDQEAAAAALLAAKEAEIAARVAAKRQQEMAQQLQAEEEAAALRQKQRTAAAKAQLDAVILRYSGAREQWASPSRVDSESAARKGAAAGASGVHAWGPAMTSSDPRALGDAAPGALKLLGVPEERRASPSRLLTKPSNALRRSASADQPLWDPFQPWGEPTLRLGPPRQPQSPPRQGDLHPASPEDSPTNVKRRGLASSTIGPRIPSPDAGGTSGPIPWLLTGMFASPRLHCELQPQYNLRVSDSPRSAGSPSLPGLSRSSSPSPPPAHRVWSSPDPVVTYGVARQMRSSPQALRVAEAEAVTQAITRLTATDTKSNPSGGLLVPRPLVARGHQWSPTARPAKFEFSSLITSLMPDASKAAPRTAGDRADGAARLLPTGLRRDLPSPGVGIGPSSHATASGSSDNSGALPARQVPTTRHPTAYGSQGNNGFESPGSSSLHSVSPSRAAWSAGQSLGRQGGLGGAYESNGGLGTQRQLNSRSPPNEVRQQQYYPHQAPFPLSLRLASPPASPRRAAAQAGAAAAAAAAAAGVVPAHGRSQRPSPLRNNETSRGPSVEPRRPPPAAKSRSTERMRRPDPSSVPPAGQLRSASVPTSSRLPMARRAAPPARPRPASTAAPASPSGAGPARTRAPGRLQQPPSLRSSQPSSAYAYPVSTASMPSSTQLTEMARRSLAASLASGVSLSTLASIPAAAHDSTLEDRPPAWGGTEAASGASTGNESGGSRAVARARQPSGGSVDLLPALGVHVHNWRAQETPKLLCRPSAGDRIGQGAGMYPADRGEPSAVPNGRRSMSADTRPNRRLGSSGDGLEVTLGGAGDRRLGTAPQAPPSGTSASTLESDIPSLRAAGRVSAPLVAAPGFQEVSAAEAEAGDLAALDVEAVIMEFERSLKAHFEFSLQPTPVHESEQYPRSGAGSAAHAGALPAALRASSFPSAASRLSNRFALHSALGDFRHAFDRLKRRLALHATDPYVAEALYGSGSGAFVGSPTRYLSTGSPKASSPLGRRPARIAPLPPWRSPGEGPGRPGSPSSSLRAAGRQLEPTVGGALHYELDSAERFYRIAAEAVAHYRDDVALLLSRVRKVLQPMPGALTEAAGAAAARQGAGLGLQPEVTMVLEAATATMRELDLRRGLVAEVLRTLEESAHQLGMQLLTLAAAPLNIPATALEQLSAELRNRQPSAGGPQYQPGVQPPATRSGALGAWAAEPGNSGSGGPSSYDSSGPRAARAAEGTATGSDFLSSVGATAASDSGDFELPPRAGGQPAGTSSCLGDMATPFVRYPIDAGGNQRPSVLGHDSFRVTAVQPGVDADHAVLAWPAGGGGSGRVQGFGSGLSGLGSGELGSQRRSALLASLFASPPASAGLPAATLNSATTRGHLSSEPSPQGAALSTLPTPSASAIPSSSSSQRMRSEPNSRPGVEPPCGRYGSSSTTSHVTSATQTSMGGGIEDSGTQIGMPSARDLVGMASDDWYAQVAALRLAQDAHAAREAAQAAAREAAAAAERQATQASALEAAVTAVREAAQVTAREAATVAAERQAAVAAAQEAAREAAQQVAQASAAEAAAAAERQLAEVTARESAHAEALEAALAAVREAAQMTAREAAAAAAERLAAEAAAREAAQATAYEAAVAAERKAAQAAARDAASERLAAQAAVLEAAQVAAREAATTAAREAALAAREAAKAAAREAADATAREAAAVAAQEAAALDEMAIAAAQEAVETTAREAAAAAAAREAAQAAAREAAAAAERHAAQASEREAAQLAALEAAVAAAREAAAAAREAAEAAARETAHASARDFAWVVEHEASQAAALEEAVATARQAAQAIAREVAAAAEREAVAATERKAAVAAAWEAAAAAERQAAQAAEREAAAASALEAAMAAARESATATAQEAAFTAARQAAEVAVREAAAAAERDFSSAAAREVATVTAAREAAEETAREVAAAALASEAAQIAAREAAATAERHAAQLAEHESTHAAALEAALAAAREEAAATAREAAKEAAREMAALQAREGELLAARQEAAQAAVMEAALIAARQTARQVLAEVEVASREATTAASVREMAASTAREAALAAVQEVTAASAQEAAARDAVIAAAREAAAAAAREAAAAAAHEVAAAAAREAAVAAAREAAAAAAQEAAVATAEREVAQAAALAAEAASAAAAMTARVSWPDAPQLPGSQAQDATGRDLPGAAAPTARGHARDAKHLELPPESVSPQMAPPYLPADPAGGTVTVHSSSGSVAAAQLEEGNVPLPVSYRALVWEMIPTGEVAGLVMAAPAAVPVRETNGPGISHENVSPVPETGDPQQGSVPVAAAAAAAVAAAYEADCALTPGPMQPTPAASPRIPTPNFQDRSGSARKYRSAGNIPRPSSAPRHQSTPSPRQQTRPAQSQRPSQHSDAHILTSAHSPNRVSSSSPPQQHHPLGPTSALAPTDDVQIVAHHGRSHGHGRTDRSMARDQGRPGFHYQHPDKLSRRHKVGGDDDDDDGHDDSRGRKVDVFSSADLTLELFRHRRQELAASPPSRLKASTAATTPSHITSNGRDSTRISSVSARGGASTDRGSGHAASGAVSAGGQSVDHRGLDPSAVLAAIQAAASATTAAVVDPTTHRDYQEFQLVKRRLGLVDRSPSPPPPSLTAVPSGPRTSLIALPGRRYSGFASASSGGPPTGRFRSMELERSRGPGHGVQLDAHRVGSSLRYSSVGGGSATSAMLPDGTNPRELVLRLQRLASRTTQLQHRVEMLARPQLFSD